MKGLTDAYAGLITPLTAATTGTADFTAATAGAARASRAAATATRAAAAGMAGTGAAARKAAADVEALGASLVTVGASAAGAGFTGGYGGRRVAQVALGASAGSSVAPSWFGGNARAAAAAAAGVNSIGGASQAALTAGGALATVGPMTQNAFRIPTSGGGASSGGGGRSVGSIIPPLAMGGLGGMALHGAMLGADAAAGYAIDGVVEASRLQTLMFGIKNSTGASAAQMRQLQQSAYDVGDLTGLSAVEAAKGMVNIARASGGVFRNKNGTFDANGLNAIIPTVLEAAQIQHITRGTNVDEAATNLMEVVHLFRDYSGDKFTKIADDLTRLSEMAPTTLKAANKQFTMFEPQFKAMGISDMDAMASYAMLARAGFGTGKGGTNINDLLGAALPALELTRHAQAGKQGLLHKYGFTDARGQSEFFTNNKADLMGFYSHIASLGKEYGRDDLVSAFKSIFGIQGGRIANLVGDPQIANQIKAIEAIMHDPRISLSEQFTGYRSQFGFQAERAGKDFQSLAGELMSQSLPGLTRGFRELGDVLHSAQHYLHEHGEIEIGIQRSVTGAVRTTSEFITSHHADWVMLKSDIGWALTAGKQGAKDLTPAMHGLADSLLGVIKPVHELMGSLDAADQFMNKVNNFPNTAIPAAGVGIQNWLAQHAPWLALPTKMVGTVPSPTSITVEQHFHGPARPTAVRQAAHDGVRSAATHGNVVTHPAVSAALSVPHH